MPTAKQSRIAVAEASQRASTSAVASVTSIEAETQTTEPFESNYMQENYVDGEQDEYFEEDDVVEQGEEQNEGETYVEEILIEPSDLIRAEDEAWHEWTHEDLSLHASQMNLALLQLAEDIAQWRVHCSKINKNGQELYEQYVQQCHRLQRTSTILKQCRRENAELSEKVAANEESAATAEQRYQSQQDRLKSNLDACQVLKDSLAAANRRVKELEAAKSEQRSAVEKQLLERETALENAMELAQSLSKNLAEANKRVAQLEEENEALTNELQTCEANFEEERSQMASNIASLQRENAEYSKQIDSLAETPGSSGAGLDSSFSSSSDCTLSAASQNSSVLETPSKRSWANMGNSSPQKRVEALSIRVETLRAHNTKLEEVVARQEKAMKMQLEEASQNEMKWKAVAKKVQLELEDVEVDLDAQKLATESLKGELEEAKQKIESSAAVAHHLELAQSRIDTLAHEVQQLEKMKADADARVEEMTSEVEISKSLKTQLDATREELEALKAAHIQSEDDMRLLYLQHKQEKADLEKTYKHEDYKTRYAEAIQRAATLHKKLTHVLQFIATNEALAKLAKDTPDASQKESLGSAWISEFTADGPETPSQSSKFANTKSIAAAGATPRKKNIVVASSSPYASPSAVTPLSCKKSRTSKVRRISMAQTTPMKIITGALEGTQMNFEKSASSDSLSSQQPSANQLVATLIEACKSWKAQAEALAERTVGLESLVVRERQMRLDAIQRASQDHEEAMQSNIDALYFGHEAQIARYESELSSQNATLEAQYEAYQSLHATYTQLVSEIDMLRMQLHNTSSDLITYRSVYEEAQVIQTEKFESEKRILEDLVSQLRTEMEEKVDFFESQMSKLKEDVEAKDETIMFMENEAQSQREAEADSRKQLLEEHYSQVSHLEVTIETQQVHMETQESTIGELKKNVEALAMINAEKDGLVEDLKNSLQRSSVAALGLAICLQRSNTDLEQVKHEYTDLNALLTQTEDEKISLSEELSFAEVLLGRAKGALILGSQREQSFKLSIDQQNKAMERLVTEHREIFGKEKDRANALESALSEVSLTHNALQSEYETSKTEWESERAEASKLMTENRIALVSTNSRMEQLAIDLAESQNRMNMLQDENDRLKEQLEAEMSENVKIAEKLETTLLALRAQEAKSTECEQKVETLENRMNEQSRRLNDAVGVAEQEKVGLSALLESTSRDAVSLRGELETTAADLEKLIKDTDRLKMEKERLEMDLERKTLELDLSLQSNTSLESSRNQLEVVVKRLETAQSETQTQNLELEQTLEMERDEMKKLCAQISNLQDTISTQAMQLQQIQQIQQQQSAQNEKNEKNAAAPSNALASSQNGLQQNLLGNGVSEELERMYADHHEWLASVKKSLITATRVYASDVTARRTEMEEECAVYRARIAELESAVQERNEEREILNEKIARHAEDLTLAKNSHRTLILQNGMLSSLIMMAQTAGAIAKTQEESQSSSSDSQSLQKSNNSVATANANASSNASLIATIAKEQGFVPEMKELMKLQRQCQSLLLKAQQYEDENKQLKIRLSESKLALYEKEDTWIAQLRACKQRYVKSEEQCKSAEHTKMQLFTFLAQIRESLVRTVQVPQIRDLLKQWTPLMASLQQQLRHQYPPTDD